MSEHTPIIRDAIPPMLSPPIFDAAKLLESHGETGKMLAIKKSKGKLHFLTSQSDSGLLVLRVFSEIPISGHVELHVKLASPDTKRTLDTTLAFNFREQKQTRRVCTKIPYADCRLVSVRLVSDHTLGAR